MAHSRSSVVPAMAAWAGLGNGPRMLYRLPGVDRLHVRFLLFLCLGLHAIKIILMIIIHWLGCALRSLLCLCRFWPFSVPLRSPCWCTA